MRKGKKSW